MQRLQRKRYSIRLTDRQYAFVKRVATDSGRSIPAVLRDFIARDMVADQEHQAAEPTIPLFDSGLPDLATRTDDDLEGFGER